MFAAAFRRVLFAGRDRMPACRPDRAVPGLVVLERETTEGRTEAWLLPRTRGESPGPALIFAHGNGELVEDWALPMGPIRDLGLHVLLLEYRGYGRSTGEPSEASVREDFVAFHDQLVARPDVDPSRIVFVGRSLGGGAIATLARERKPRALVLLSTFTSAADRARELFPIPRFLVPDPFEVRDVVRTLGVPTWILHGRSDEVISVRHGEALAEACGGRLSLYDAGHDDCPPDWAVFVEELRRFLEGAGVLG
ncbi:MAG: alpha/beta hydrolase [Polyangiales bacterium]